MRKMYVVVVWFFINETIIIIQMPISFALLYKRKILYSGRVCFRVYDAKQKDYWFFRNCVYSLYSIYCAGYFHQQGLCCAYTKREQLREHLDARQWRHFLVWQQKQVWDILLRDFWSRYFFFIFHRNKTKWNNSWIGRKNVKALYKKKSSKLAIVFQNL